MTYDNVYEGKVYEKKFAEIGGSITPFGPLTSSLKTDRASCAIIVCAQEINELYFLNFVC